MEERVKKILQVSTDYTDGFGLDVLLNPNILDEYLFSHKREKNHICRIKEFLSDFNLFANVIRNHSFKNSDFLYEIEAKTCAGCMLNCASTVNPIFNFVAYLIVVIVDFREPMHKRDKQTLTINCLNLFSLSHEQDLIFDFEKMSSYIMQYDVIMTNYILELNNPIISLEYLNELRNFISEVEINLSIFGEFNNLFGLFSKNIGNKEVYYNNKLRIEELKSKSGFQPVKLPFKFENKFDMVDENRVYNYFTDSLVKKGHLSKQDLEKYLLLAFQDESFPSERFELKKIHIGNITNVFYTYYRELSLYKQGDQERYAKLLGNYFKGFSTEKVVNNFARNYKNVRK